MVSMLGVGLLLAAQGAAAASHSSLRVHRLGRATQPAVSAVAAPEQTQSMGATSAAAAAIKLFKDMQSGKQPPPPLTGLSKECKAKLEEEHKTRTGLFGQPQDCKATPCTFRMEFTPAPGKVETSEGPACFPKECQNAKDTKIFVQNFQDKMKNALDTVNASCQKHYKDTPEKCPVQEGYQIAVQMDCSASDGAAKSSGTSADGDRSISVDDDYIHDAQPLPRNAMLVTDPPPLRGTEAGAALPPKRNGSAALAPTFMVVVAALLSLML